MHHRVFLSITAGPTPREAVPILATEDRDVIRAAVEAIRARVGCDDALGEPLRPAEAQANEEGS